MIYQRQTIQKKIHFFWASAISESGTIPNDVAETLDAWSQTHPSYMQKVWSLQDVFDLAESLARHDVVEALTSCRLIAMKSDIARALILAAEGGVYSDLKNFPSKAFLDKYISFGTAVLVRYPPNIIVGDQTRTVFNGFLISPPAHPLFLGLLGRICNNVATRKMGGAFDITGSGPLTEEVGQFLRDDLVVLSANDIWETSENSVRPLKRVDASYNGPKGEFHWEKAEKLGVYN